MARSKDFRKYVIVTKSPKYKYFHTDGNFDTSEIEDNFDESDDKTFWMFTKKGELVDRYSVKSAPQWVLEIKEILT